VNFARRALSVLALAGVLTAGPGMAQAAPVAAKNQCLNGGYVNYIDPSTGQSFVDQGTCISFVNHGGSLQATLSPSIQVREIPTLGGLGTYTLEYVVSGFRPGETIFVHYVFDNGDTGASEYQTDSSGGVTGRSILSCGAYIGVVTRLLVHNAAGDLEATATVQPSCPPPPLPPSYGVGMQYHFPALLSTPPTPPTPVCRNLGEIRGRGGHGPARLNPPPSSRRHPCSPTLD
jgi:hypothetical protein